MDGKGKCNPRSRGACALHGWIDDVWERYREVKGLASDPSDPLEDEIASQCWEMHELGHVVDTSCQDKLLTLPKESGAAPPGS